MTKSFEKLLGKTRKEAKQQSERMRRDEDKRMRQERKLAHKEEIRQRATSIVNGQEIIDGIRILDTNAELILKRLIEHCSNQENGRMTIDNAIFPVQFQASLGLEFEKLTQYGMITVISRLRTCSTVILLPATFEYFHKKEIAMEKKSPDNFQSVENNFYGNTNILNAPANSSTIIAGNNNSVSSSNREPVTKTEEENKQNKTINNTIFISHRSIDCEYVKMLCNFLRLIGIPKEAIFCSSLPGNDVKEKISDEVKGALRSSKINIAILSKEYYESTYCLNEAGILWFLDTTVLIPIALPEITYDQMIGFLNDEYKLRRLDNENDIAYIYQMITEKLGITQTNPITLQSEIQELKNNYKNYQTLKAI